MTKIKLITTILIGLTFVACGKSLKNNDNNTLSLSDTVEQISKDSLKRVLEIGTSITYSENAIYVGQPISDFVSLTEQLFNVKKETISLEGDDYDIYNVYANGQILFGVEPEFNKPDKVWRIWIYSSDFKTEKGIGVGSTLADIKMKYQVENIGTEEGLNVRVKDISVSFLMDNSKIWWDNLRNEEVFKNIPIRTMIIWDSESYLTLDKKVKTNRRN
ncbi:MAG: hypothetical protein ACK4VN_01310 [Bacteroidales bacterium]